MSKTNVLYEVSITVNEDLCSGFEKYMTEKHIPEVVATGCFVAAVFSIYDKGQYRTSYEAPDRLTLDRYLTEHAPRLRQDFIKHFPDSVKISRKEWQIIEEFRID